MKILVIMTTILLTSTFAFEIKNNFDECIISIYDNEKFDIDCANKNFNGHQTFESILALESLRKDLNSKSFCVQQKVIIKGEKTLFYTKDKSSCL